MAVTASTLRSNIYKLLDETLTSGKPLQIKRKGQELSITPVRKSSKLSNLTRHDCIVGNPEELVHNDWSDEWNHDLP
jgi:hypothetical protein